MNTYTRALVEKRIVQLKRSIEKNREEETRLRDELAEFEQGTASMIEALEALKSDLTP